MYTDVYTYVYTYVSYVYTYYICVYICAYTHTHTGIHTYMQACIHLMHTLNTWRIQLFGCLGTSLDPDLRSKAAVPSPEQV